MQSNEITGSRSRRRRSVVGGVLAAALLGTGLIAASAEAGPTTFPKSFNPETAAGFTNTFSTKSDLSPACPQALAGTPGSDPASKILNDALNTDASFLPGGTVHYTYKDNPHLNGGTQNFTIQDCVVVYLPNTFVDTDFNDDGVLINATKNQLKGGTQIDGASLSGISSSVGSIYFSWTSPDAETLLPGSWVCNFARDIRNNHGGGGNRKVPPTCYQVPEEDGGPDPLTNLTPEIWLAYADTLHDPNVQFLPDPWEGDPNVVYLGCTQGDAYCGPKFDGGAIRIDNLITNGARTLTGANVVIETTDGTRQCIFTPWDSYLPADVPPAGQMILTQTGTTDDPQAPPCDGRVEVSQRATTNFDTSEGPFDTISPAFSNCNPALVKDPVITLTFSDGMTLTIVDKGDAILGSILNTGHVDRFACSRLDEATPWTQVPLANVTRTPPGP